jgi:hypothetical protein
VAEFAIRALSSRAKHSKTLIHWLIANDLAKNTVIGYDTGCTLGQTLKKSDMLGPDVKKNETKCGK